MVKITFLGHSAFKIKSATATVITDPFDPSFTGLKFSKQSADIVTISHDHADHNYLGKIDGDPFVIREPGEYEVKGAQVIGLQSFHDNKRGSQRGENIVYAFHIEEYIIAHLGDLGCPLTPEQIEGLNTIDVLLIPVGGTYTLDAEMASELIAQIEPTYVIPMHYQLPGLKMELDPVEKFIEQMGMGSARSQPSLDLRSRVGLSEETSVVILDSK